MSKTERIRAVVEDFIDVMHLQTKEIEKLIEYVERSAGHLGYTNQFSVVASRLTEFHVRTKKLQAPVKHSATVVASQGD